MGQMGELQGCPGHHKWPWRSSADQAGRRDRPAGQTAVPMVPLYPAQRKNGRAMRRFMAVRSAGLTAAVAAVAIAGTACSSDSGNATGGQPAKAAAPVGAADALKGV